MAANLSLIPYTAQTHAGIGAAHAFCDGSGNRRFADTRRANQANDLPLDIRAELAHGQNFKNAILYFFQSVMIPVQNRLCALDVQIVYGEFAPRQIQAGVQIGPNHSGFLTVSLHTGQTIRLLHELFTCFVRQRQGLNPAAIGIRLSAGILRLIQLIRDGTHLFPQVIIPLVFVHLLIDFVVDFFFNLKDLAFAAQQCQNML